MNRIPLLIDGRAFSLQTKGGVSQIWTRILNSPGFMDQFEVDLFLYPNFHGNIHLQESGLLENPGIRQIHSPIPPSDNMNFCNAAHAEQRRQAILGAFGARQPRIVLNTYYGENILPDCLRYMVVVHDFAHEDTEVLSGRESTPHVLFMKQQALKAATDLIHISGSTRARAQALYPALVSGKRSAVIYHGQDDAVRVKRTAGKFVHVGNRGLYKDFATVAKAFHALLGRRPDVQLSVIGGEAEDDMVTGLIGKFPDQVRFATNVTDEAIMSEIASASVFVSASHYEGFGIPVLNAMHVGTTPVLANIPVYQEISQHFALFFTPGDSAALEAQLEASLLKATLLPPNAARPWPAVAREYARFIRNGIENV